VVTICTTSLTFNNSTFCPHTVFMCFVWICEQTAIISLYSINCLVFITEMKCVYCEVRTEFWSKILVNRVLKPTVSCLRRLVGGLLPRRHGFDPSSLHMRFVVNKFSLGRFFLPGRRYCMSVSFHHSYISIYTLLLPEGQTGETRKSPKKEYLWALQFGICVSRLWFDHCHSRSMIWDLAVRDNSVSGCWSKAVFLNRRAAARYRALASIIPGRERFCWNLSFYFSKHFSWINVL